MCSPNSDGLINHFRQIFVQAGLEDVVDPAIAQLGRDGAREAMAFAAPAAMIGEIASRQSAMSS